MDRSAAKSVAGIGRLSPWTELPKTPPSSKEKRKNQRIPADLWTHLTRISEKDAPVDVYITDVSAGGAGFVTHDELKPGECVRINIPLGILISVKARVTCSIPADEMFRHGTDFVEMDPQHYQVLTSHVLRKIKDLGLKPLESDLVCA
ncbi:PilZ domain-containing protein [Elusimicrobiota bacterium]